MKSKSSKSSRELKQEVIQELNQVNSDLDRIQGRLTPGQFIDDTLFQPAGRNPRAIFDHLAANPIGTAFLSLGTFLLMEDDSHVTYETHLKNKAASAAENTRYQATLLKGSASNLNEKVHESVAGYSEKLHGVIDKTRHKVKDLKDKFPGMGRNSSVNATGERDLGAGGELGVSSLDVLKENSTEIKDTVTGKVNQRSDRIDPMAWMAIGAGLGALTGIALPVSEREQILIDQKLSGTLNEFSAEFQEAINSSLKVLRDEFLAKFSQLDVNLFGKISPVNETTPSSQG